MFYYVVYFFVKCCNLWVFVEMVLFIVWCESEFDLSVVFGVNVMGLM